MAIDQAKVRAARSRYKAKTLARYLDHMSSIKCALCGSKEHIDGTI